MEMFSTTPQKRTHIVFDPIYGFIHMTPVEKEIILSPFYQRMRWIKQLGFSFYVFPGAEHSRFGHSIGVMNNAHHILKSCDCAVDNRELMDPDTHSKEKDWHQMIRLGALMHDLGTFAFSHTTEMAYIRFGETTNKAGGKGLSDDHENLGAYIIKNTDYPGGIAYILKKYGYDPQRISDLVKGVDPSIMANQILHSEIDCDRMDYLLRDAHYTGLKYGSYDRDYLLHHFERKNVGGHDILTIRHSALHCVEDFLQSRFAWYSQVIRSSRGAKYDAIAEGLCYYFLEKGVISRYSDLLEQIEKDPVKFWNFQDSYFMGILHQQYASGAFDKEKEFGMKDMAKTLLFAQGARHVRCEELKQRLVSQDDPEELHKYMKRAEAKVEEIRKVVENKGAKDDWFIADLPQKQIIFVQSSKSLVTNNKTTNVLLERDPVKISYENGEIKLLAEVENSVISRLKNTMNFIPNIFCSQKTHDLLVKEGVIENIRPSEEVG